MLFPIPLNLDLFETSDGDVIVSFTIENQDISLICMVVADFTVRLLYTDSFQIQMLWDRGLFRCRIPGLHGDGLAPELRDKNLLQIAVGTLHIADIVQA